MLEKIMPDLKDFELADMDRWLTENNVTEIECLVPDLTGVARGKILPREKFRQNAPCACQRRCLVFRSLVNRQKAMLAMIG